MVPCDENCKPYSIKQIRTKYIVVSTDLQLEFFDVKAMTKIGNLQTGGFYSLMLRANSSDMEFELEDELLQEACIGFTNGAFFKTALVCKQSQEAQGDVEMQEESKSPTEQRRL